MFFVKGAGPIKYQSIISKSVEDATPQVPLCMSLLKSTRHICLLSAFISQHASDSLGKLKAHVYAC
jgi:hypothetical protein